MAAPRTITPFLQKLRNLLIKRPYKNHLRFEGKITTRTQDPPNLPDGVSHKLSANYYLTRDGRRELTPPEAVYTGKQLLASGEEGAGAAKRKPVAAGFIYNWETGKSELN